MQYKIDLDDFCEDVFHILEELSEGNHGHEFVVSAGDKDHACELTSSLLKPFLYEKLKEV